MTRSAPATTPTGGRPLFKHARTEDMAMRVCCLCGMTRDDAPHLCTAEVVSMLKDVSASALA